MCAAVSRARLLLAGLRRAVGAVADEEAAEERSSVRGGHEVGRLAGA